MNEEIETLLGELSYLFEKAQNKKILLEEIRIISKRAFELQDLLTPLIEEKTETETDIAAVQQLFDTQEAVWDTVNKIVKLEMEIKEKTYSKETYKQKKENAKEPAHREGDCGCHDAGCACHCHDEPHACHCHDEPHDCHCSDAGCACHTKKTIH